MEQQTLYRDIATRTEGDIYIGVVGPVRTGKSTFIKRFMELLVLPNIVGEHRRERAMDEMPVSGAGRTIMTTQPRFVPNEAVELKLPSQGSFRVRLVDCVGYLIHGALGTQEDESARMVRTPWFEHDIPFEEAAEVGTRRVISEHSTLGVVVTTDGTITDIPRSAYIDAEERAVRELRALGKPFAVVLNSRVPESVEANRLRDALAEKYDVPVTLLSVENMNLTDVNELLESILMEFPLSEVWLDMPGWISALPEGHWLGQAALAGVVEAAGKMRKVRDWQEIKAAFSDSEYFDVGSSPEILLSEGAVRCPVVPADGLFYRVLSETCGQQVDGEEHLFSLMTELTQSKREYDRVRDALKSVRETGYALVAPEQSEMTLKDPELVRQGNRFGVKLKASAPSLHMIRVDIETEVSPIVGTEKQSEELMQYLMSEFENDPGSIWTTNMFGKPLSELVREGLAGKLMRMPDETRQKVQEALQKIINEGNGGMICILL